MISIRSNIIKFGAVVLLAAIFQTYICSTFCSFDGQCLPQRDKVEKDCCSHEHKEQSHDHDCQKDHMAFLKTVGQYHSYDICTADKIFECDLIKFYQDDPQYISFNGEEFFTGFHPPPPKNGIPVLVQSFLI